MSFWGDLYGQYQQKRYAVPLVGATACVAVVDFVAEVTLKQRYQNAETDPIEAVYEFLLDPKAAVSAFWVEVDDKKIIGKVQEKQQARDTYDNAIASGHGAYLLEEDEKKANRFSASVGNLPPGKEVLVVIQYVTELEFENDRLRFIAAAQSLPASTGASLFAAPRHPDGPYSREVRPGLEVEIDLQMSSPIKSVSSSSHPIAMEFLSDSTRNARVTLTGDDARPGVDFVLEIALSEPHRPCARLQRDHADNVVAMVCLYPELKEDLARPLETEIIFLVDRSGSMSGASIEAVRETMQVFLRSLSPGTLFNIVGFGSSFHKLFRTSVKYDDESLKAASDHVRVMQADLGGTNVLSPLLDILAQPAATGRQIFLLTDGEVENPDACIEAVRKHSQTTRVFTFGVGEQASRQLVHGIAKAGEGASEIIRHGENMDAKVIRQLGRALKPALTELRLDWAGLLDVRQTPRRLPVVFGGSRLVAYGYLPKDGLVPARVTLHAKLGSTPVSFGVDLNPAFVEPGSVVGKLAAKSMIRDLEEKRSWLHDESGGVVPPGSDASVTKAIVDLSVGAQIVSKLTAFVAVERRKDAVDGGAMALREMRLEEGWARPRARPVTAFGGFAGVPGMAYGSARSMAFGSGASRGPPAACAAPSASYASAPTASSLFGSRGGGTHAHRAPKRQSDRDDAFGNASSSYASSGASSSYASSGYGGGGGPYSYSAQQQQFGAPAAVGSFDYRAAHRAQQQQLSAAAGAGYRGGIPYGRPEGAGAASRQGPVQKKAIGEFAESSHHPGHRLRVVDSSATIGPRYAAGAVCDVCGQTKSATDRVFHCTQCPEFDLCEGCMSTSRTDLVTAALHAQHTFARYDDVTRIGPNYQQQGGFCDSCRAAVPPGSSVFHCTVCPEYDLCLLCQSSPAAAAAAAVPLASLPRAAPPFAASAAPPPAFQQQHQQHPKTPSSSASLLHEVIKLQRASGTFEQKALELLGVPPTAVVAAYPSALPRVDDLLEALATAVVCELINERFPEYQVSWELVVRKGRAWVADALRRHGVDPDGPEWSSAKQAVRSTART